MAKRFAVQTSITVILMLIMVVVIGAVFSDFSENFFADSFCENHLKTLEMMRSSVIGAIDKSFGDIADGGFDLRILFSEDGGILKSTSSTPMQGTVKLFGEKASQKFFEKEGFAVSTEYNGVAMYLIVEQASADGFRLGGLISNAAFESSRKSYMSGNVMLILLSVVVCLIGTALICLSYKHKEDRLTVAVPMKNYLLTVDKNGKVLSANKLFSAKFKYKNLSASNIDKTCSIGSAAKEGKNIVFSLVDVTGEKRYLSLAPLWSVGGIKLVGNDVTEQVSEYFSLVDKNKYDAVTGLLRGSYFESDWEKVRAAGREKECALAYINIGSRSYYEILVGANKVRKVVRAYTEQMNILLSKYGTLYFYENDDVLLFVQNASLRAEFVRGIYDIVKEMNRPVKLEGFAYKPDCRMGVVLTDACDAATTAENVVYNAKIALGNAVKNISGGIYVLHTDRFSYKKVDFTEEGLVEKMIEEGEVEVFFQPQYNTKTKKIVGFEALTRLNGNKKREINIQQFMSIAEQYGGIIELGNFVAEKAMAFAKRVEQYGVSVSINVSPAQIMQTGFVDGTFAALEKSGAKAESISIEIVESTMVYSFNEAISKLNLLKEKGMGIHIDDFGVAYSSMLYLKKLPITALKIDKEFIDDVTVDERAAAIVKNIINLASDLGLMCICEGVEAEAQSKLLQSLGCNIIQGFLYGGAVPEETAYESVKENNNK